jgi:DNA-binding GntR family transcriptional regulator
LAAVKSRADPTAAPQPLRIETVVDRVYDEVRRRIESGDLPRGSKLRQEPLADALGVSRTPLREALRRLAAEGLVEFHPNRGASVVALSSADVRAAYEARLDFEPGAARLAALRRPAGALVSLWQAVEAQRRSQDARSAYASSRSFHLALVRASGNDYLVRLAEALWRPGLAQAIYERQTAAAERVIDDVHEHEAIAVAVEAGDADRAERLTRAHIESALAGMIGADGEAERATGG